MLCFFFISIAVSEQDLSIYGIFVILLWSFDRYGRICMCTFSVDLKWAALCTTCCLASRQKRCILLRMHRRASVSWWYLRRRSLFQVKSGRQMRLINYARQERQQQQRQQATRTSRPWGKWWKVSTSRRFCDGNCWMSWRLGGIVKPIFVRFVLIYVHGTICFAFREPIK